MQKIIQSPSLLHCTRGIQVIFGVMIFGISISGHIGRCPFERKVFDSEMHFSALMIMGAAVALSVPAWGYYFHRKKRDLSSRCLTLTFDLIWCILTLGCAISASFSPAMKSVCNSGNFAKAVIENLCQIDCRYMGVSISSTFILFFTFLATLFLTSQQYSAAQLRERYRAGSVTEFHDPETPKGEFQLQMTKV